jgi:UDP-N-acetylglucosamine--dolichyl-phosphate N-acetylglucosaminephosphotransferase
MHLSTDGAHLFTPWVAGLVTAYVMPLWIKKAKRIGLVGKDLHKIGQPFIPESGGLPVIFGFFIGMSLFWLYDRQYEYLWYGVMICSFAGVIDDFLGWKQGLAAPFRIILVLLGWVPFIAGLDHPLHIGIILSLILALHTLSFNFLAGYNGLEAGQGIIILSGLFIIFLISRQSDLMVLAFMGIIPLSIFLRYNIYPARIFPGDSLTYFTGALIGALLVLGELWVESFFILGLYGMEVILKLRGRLKKESFAKVHEDGTLEAPYAKIYGIEHAVICWMKNPMEPKVVKVIWFLQLILSLMGILVFYFLN